MHDIKPIETLYQGYRFRSRLEARWAVFFDTLGIEWQYEKEGFELPNGTRYLPDFWLPKLDCWIEIKGQDPTEGEHAKLARQWDGQSVFFAEWWESLNYGMCQRGLCHAFPAIVCFASSKHPNH